MCVYIEAAFIRAKMNWILETKKKKKTNLNIYEWNFCGLVKTIQWMRDTLPHINFQNDSENGRNIYKQINCLKNKWIFENCLKLNYKKFKEFEKKNILNKINFHLIFVLCLKFILLIWPHFFY